MAFYVRKPRNNPHHRPIGQAQRPAQRCPFVRADFAAGSKKRHVYTVVNKTDHAFIYAEVIYEVLPDRIADSNDSITPAREMHGAIGALKKSHGTLLHAGRAKTSEPGSPEPE